MGTASGSDAPVAARRSLAGAAGFFVALTVRERALRGSVATSALLVRDAARLGVTPASGSARSRLRALRSFGKG